MCAARRKLRLDTQKKALTVSMVKQWSRCPKNPICGVSQDILGSSPRIQQSQPTTGLRG